MAKLSRLVGLLVVSFAIAIILTIPLGAPTVSSGSFGDRSSAKGTYRLELVYAEQRVDRADPSRAPSGVIATTLDTHAGVPPVTHADWSTISDDLRAAAIADGLIAYFPAMLLARGNTHVTVRQLDGFAGIATDPLEPHASSSGAEYGIASARGAGSSRVDPVLPPGELVLSVFVAEAKDKDFARIEIQLARGTHGGEREVMYETAAVVESGGGYVIGEPFTLLPGRGASSRLVGFRVTKMPESH
ncbi:MAG: hypothetical protein AAGI30_07275 [Planctomycetota bacterium]